MDFEYAEKYLNFFPNCLLLYEVFGWTAGCYISMVLIILLYAYLNKLKQWSKFKWQGGHDQWAVVVGATGALGREYTKNLLEKDYNLLLISNNSVKLKELKLSMIKKETERIIKTLVIDLRKDDHTIYSSLESVLNDLGGNVDVWVNAFSIIYPNNKPNYIRMIQDEVIEDIIMVNVIAFTR